MRRLLIVTLGLTAGLTLSLRAQDLNELQEKAMTAALQKIAPSVVAIETSGGTDVIVAGPRGQRIRKGTGPTTGVIVSPDGYVITSAFNFANKPSSIMVAVPGKKERYVAKVVATDQTRMLTLLQLLNFNEKNLPVPAAYPIKDIKVGMTALAVGRTLASSMEELPSLSRGIVSATQRIWGKAVQTDAKVSPVNYGGPLIDYSGKVIGILVPSSPRAEGETAGFEWYDSGIGFAMYMEDVLRMLPRMKTGKDLQPGLLGVTMRGGEADLYGAQPIIATVAPASPAETVGLKPGDRLVEIDGKPVNNYAQLKHQLGNKYKDDKIALKYERDKNIVEIKEVTLGGAKAEFAQAFLGILPMRDDPEPGVEVRYVFPKSPADTAGIKEGDRITKLKGPRDPALRPVAGREQLANALAALRPGMPVEVEYLPKGAKEAKKVTVPLGDFVESVPAKLPEKASHEKALTPKKPVGGGPAPMPPMKEEKKEDKKDEEKPKPQTGLLKRSNAARDRTYWIYVPDDYDPNISYALVLWLHPVGKNKERDIEKVKAFWEDACSFDRMIVVAPVSDNETGWAAPEIDFVNEAIRTVSGSYTVDRRRVVAHGMGMGGQMAFYMGFQSRDLIRGVATVGSVLTSNPKERVPNQPLSFYIAVGDKDPILEAVKESKDKISEYRYPAIFRELKEKGHQYFDTDTSEQFKEMIRWIDSLDRL